MSQEREMQKFIRFYKEEMGETEVDMHKVAEYAAIKGWKLPMPISPIDLLAKKFSKAARSEIRHDKSTGRPYRANHAFPHGQLTLWVDIDEAPRKHMVKSVQMRREQMVGDAFQLTLDLDHWNSVNNSDEPIKVELDFHDDVEWRKAAEDEDEGNAVI